jgi:hypothetical protein
VRLIVLALTVSVAASAAGARAATAEGATPPAFAETAVVVAGTHYRAGRLHRFLFGDDYRDLWTMPFEVEVLDLDQFGGGLTPERLVGQSQSSGLALRGRDGRAYTFRGLEKDATRGLAPELRQTIAGRIAQDQTAALHPAAAVVAGPLLDAAGVLHTDAHLVVMPDDARLGEFRSDFAGRLGTIQEFPREARAGNGGFHGATEIIAGRNMLELLGRTPTERADSREYLRARLVDLFLGDWDRHLGQWRWAKIPGRTRWQPIPEDRDFAFCRFEGLVLVIARNWYPRWVAYGRKYPDMLGLTWQAWPLDREVLSDLESPAWAEIATDLQRRLTDRVIEDAVQRLPDEYRRADGPRLSEALRARRDGLARAAERFYRLLAEEVRVTGTDQGDVAEAVAVDGGALDVALYRAGASGAPDGAPWYRRRFHPGETAEVRIDLRGGDDRFVARGRSGIRVRVVGGDGDDVLDDSAAGGARFSDAAGRNQLVRGAGTTVDERPYEPPPLESESPYLPQRDWGRDTTYLPWLAVSPDFGAFVGGGVRLERYAFRMHPFASRHVFRVGYATTTGGFRADYDGEYRRENSARRVTLSARATQIDILHFYGLGNDTDRPMGSSFYEVRQTRLSITPRMVVPLGSTLTVSAGPELEYARTRRPADRFIGQVRPYGSEPFGQLGAVAEVRFDSRDPVANAGRGVLLAAGGSFHPAVLDVRHPFGDVHGEVAGHLAGAFRFRPTLSLRTGVRKVFGTYPFHEAAFVGGPETVRGFNLQRFAGDAEAHGSAELRLSLGRYFLVLPGEYGVFALADTGRVWLRGDSSTSWHTGVGGGIWFAYLDRRNTVTIAAARSPEGTGLYVRAGFLF